jgi:hypothetical protein
MGIIEDDVKGGFKMLHWRVIREEIFEFFRRFKSIPKDSEENYLLRLLEEAKQDWSVSRSHFNDMTEEEMIDHAIYTMDAAEQRFSYLLKKAKEERVRAEKIQLI